MSRRTTKGLKAASAIARAAAEISDFVDSWAAERNHPAWYLHHPTEGLINLNFGRRETAYLPNADSSIVLNSGTARRWTPWDAIIDVALTHPKVEGFDGPLNEAAGIILNQMRAVATTTAPYTQGDIYWYLEDLRNLLAAYSQARRLGDSLNLSDAYDADAYYKYALMCMPGGVMWKDVQAEKAQLDAALSRLTPLIKNLFPAQVDVLERTKWMFANIFTDSTSAKFSTKVFRAKYWRIKDAEGKIHVFGFDNTASLRVDKTQDALTSNMDEDPETGMTFHKLKATPLGLIKGIEEMIGIMIQNPMESRIAGDLLKAFGQKAFMEIPPYEPGKHTPFIYDEDVLNQIQNLTIAGAIYGFHEDGDILFEGAYRATAQYPNHIVTTYHDTVEPGRVMSLTRLSAFLDDGTYFKTGANPADPDMDAPLYRPNTCGTEVVCNYTYVYVTGDTFEGEQYLGVVPYTGAPGDYLFMSNVLNAWSSDDWAPLLMFDPIGTNLADFPVMLIDTQNWALMNEKDMAILTSTASLSLYTIPYLVKKQDTFAFVN